MTDQEINIAIAEWIGWKGWYCEKCHSEIPPHQVAYDEHHSDPDDHCGGQCFPSKPYCSDLNIICQAESMLDAKEARTFGEQLCKVMSPHSPNGYGWCLYIKDPWTGLDIYVLSHANARQRAEALLRTVGKWKD